MKLLKRLKAWWIRRKERGPYSIIYGCYANSPEYPERRAAKLYEICAILDWKEAERERKKAEREEKERRKAEKRAEKAKRKAEKREQKKKKEK